MDQHFFRDKKIICNHCFSRVNVYTNHFGEDACASCCEQLDPHRWNMLSTDAEAPRLEFSPIVGDPYEIPFDPFLNNTDDVKRIRTIRDHLAYLRIESTNMEQATLKYMKSLEWVLKKEEDNQNKTFRFMEKSLMAYSLYQTLADEGCPRTMDEIANIFSLKEKHLLQIEASSGLIPTLIPGSTYVERIIDTLDLPFWLGAYVKKILHVNPQLQMYKPVNVISVIISKLFTILNTWDFKKSWCEHQIAYHSLMRCFLERSKLSEICKTKMTIPIICSILGLNPPTLYNIARKLSTRKIVSFMRIYDFNDQFYSPNV